MSGWDGIDVRSNELPFLNDGDPLHNYLEEQQKHVVAASAAEVEYRKQRDAMNAATKLDVLRNRETMWLLPRPSMWMTVGEMLEYVTKVD